MKEFKLFYFIWLGHSFPVAYTFQQQSGASKKPTMIAAKRDISLTMGPFGFLGGGASAGGISDIPTTPSNRDKQAIASVKAAITKPKTPSFPLIECEFPPLKELNKLSDGSLRSTNLVDDANLAFCAKLVKGLGGLMGPKVHFLTSTSVASGLMAKSKAVIKGAVSVTSMRDGIPEGMGSKTDVCVLLSPSSRQDYLQAKQIALSGVPIVLVNGLAKDKSSVSSQASMAYYLKPLTYNSQVVGYLVRTYPKGWATIDLVSKEVLGSFKDDEILVSETNTPDLRQPGRLVQKSVDERAIRARKN